MVSFTPIRACIYSCAAVCFWVLCRAETAVGASGLSWICSRLDLGAILRPTPRHTPGSFTGAGLHSTARAGAGRAAVAAGLEDTFAGRLRGAVVAAIAGIDGAPRAL